MIPKSKEIDRLHIKMYRTVGGAAVVSDDEGILMHLADIGFEADVAKILEVPIGACTTFLSISRVVKIERIRQSASSRSYAASNLIRCE